MVAQQLEKVRRRKQNQNWRDVWIRDLERERVEYLRQKKEDKRSCFDMEADESGDIEKIGKCGSKEDSEVLAQDHNDAKDLSVKQNETEQNDEIVEIPKSRQKDFGKRDNLAIQIESSKKRKRSQESALNRLINDTMKVNKTSTSSALMENLTECSTMINNGSGYEPSQELQISDSQVNNQYGSSQELQISESQVNNQYKPSQFQEYPASKQGNMNF